MLIQTVSVKGHMAITRLLSQRDDVDDEWVAIQCDDAVFVIQRVTITNGAPGSILAMMFSTDDAHQESGMLLRRDCVRNTSHPLKPFVFDRTAQYVAPVIHYLRTGELVLNGGVSKRGVLLEAEYFGVVGLVTLLRSTPKEFDSDGETEDSESISSTTLSNQPTPPPTGKGIRVPPPCCTREELLASLRTMPPDAGLRLRGMCLNKISFAKLDLRNTNFEMCSLLHCDFSDADLSRCNFSRSKAMGSQFARCTLQNSLCLEANFSNCNFERARCVDSNFTGSTMRELQAKQCDFSRSVLIQCDLSHADLCGTVLVQTQLRYTILTGVERCGTSISMGGVIQ